MIKPHNSEIISFYVSKKKHTPTTLGMVSSYFLYSTEMNNKKIKEGKPVTNIKRKSSKYIIQLTLFSCQKKNKDIQILFLLN